MSAIDRLRRVIADAGTVDLALRLTLLDLLLLPIGDWTLRPGILVLACTGLLFPAMLRRSGLWWLLTASTGLRVALDYPLADNHAYLLCYWCLAIALALSSKDPLGFLGWNGRRLIGLVFAFATLWKVALSPDFMDGTFFRVTLLVDPRFEDLTRLLGRLSLEEIAAYRDLLERHADGPMIASGGMTLPMSFDVLAQTMTWWTVLIESFLAAAFLWPEGRGPSRLRDAALLVFCATTYAAATVEGFGWLLIAMGVSQCGSQRPWTRALYLAVFVLILGYRELPWTAPLLEALAPR